MKKSFEEKKPFGVKYTTFRFDEDEGKMNLYNIAIIVGELVDSTETTLNFCPYCGNKVTLNIVNE